MQERKQREKLQSSSLPPAKILESPKIEEKQQVTQSSSPPPLPSLKPKSNIKESKDGTISAPKYANPEHSAKYKDEDDDKYQGDYLDKKLFRMSSKGDLGVSMTPKNEKLLIIIGMASLMFGIFIYCICSCCQDKKKTYEQVEEDLR